MESPHNSKATQDKGANNSDVSRSRSAYETRYQVSRNIQPRTPFNESRTQEPVRDTAVGVHVEKHPTVINKHKRAAGTKNVIFIYFNGQTRKKVADHGRENSLKATDKDGSFPSDRTSNSALFPAHEYTPESLKSRKVTQETDREKIPPNFLLLVFTDTD